MAPSEKDSQGAASDQTDSAERCVPAARRAGNLNYLTRAAICGYLCYFAIFDFSSNVYPLSLISSILSKSAGGIV